jgi:hypothetical protein
MRPQHKLLCPRDDIIREKLAFPRELSATAGDPVSLCAPGSCPAGDNATAGFLGVMAREPPQSAEYVHKTRKRNKLAPAPKVAGKPTAPQKGQSPRAGTKQEAVPSWGGNSTWRGTSLQGRRKHRPDAGFRKEGRGRATFLARTLCRINALGQRVI